METPTQESAIDLSAYVEMRDGRANVRGRRLTIAHLAAAIKANKGSIEETAYDMTLSAEQILAAMLYYQLHKAEIDAQDAEDAREFDKMHARYGGQPGKQQAEQ